MAVVWKKLAFSGDAPAAHTLASHSTKAHSELSDAPEGAHHTKFTTTEHTAIGNGAPHHAASHSIASHNDTTGTGAELNTLTGGGETALHSHAGGGPTIATGNYTGNDGNNRQIATGFKCSLAIVLCASNPFLCYLSIGTGIGMLLINLPYVAVYTSQVNRMLLHATDGFTADFTSGTYSPNLNNETYYYWAISE